MKERGVQQQNRQWEAFVCSEGDRVIALMKLKLVMEVLIHNCTLLIPAYLCCSSQLSIVSAASKSLLLTSSLSFDLLD